MSFATGLKVCRVKAKESKTESVILRREEKVPTAVFVVWYWEVVTLSKI